MKERIDKLEQKYMDWRNYGTKAFENATSDELPILTRKADEEIVKLKARIAELEKKIEDHNIMCDFMCESRDCDPRYRKPGLSCGDCYKDWKVE